MVMICEFYYEGTAQLSCAECEETFEIIFQDSSHHNIIEVIKEQAKEEGWRNGKCPDCIKKSKKGGSCEQLE
jgi:hypothetical protein